MKFLGPMGVVLIFMVSIFAGFPFDFQITEAQQIPHDQIRIEGDEDFARQAANESWPGDGTEGNPYVIEDYEINISNGYGIEIISTRVHFMIRDSVFRLGRTPNDAGVYFSDVRNGIISNCTIEDNIIGVHLNFSDENTIADNIMVANTETGVLLTNSNHNTIFENNLDDIFLEYSNNNNITSNNIASLGVGIDLFFSNNNIIKDNYAASLYRGMYLDSSNENIINANQFYDTERGISIISSKGNHLSENKMTGGGIGIVGSIVDYWSSHDIDTSNTVNGKSAYYWNNRVGGVVPLNAGQVILANCTGSEISNQVIEYGTSGIQMGFSSQIIITRNTINSTYYSAISIDYCNNCTISNNTIFRNDYGIEIFDSIFMKIEENHVSANNYGIIMKECEESKITKNTVSHNNPGIGIWDSIEIDLTYNEIDNDGISIWYDKIEHTISHHIDTSNTVNGKPVYYWKNINGGTVPLGAGLIILANCTGVTVEDQTIQNTYDAINLCYTSDCNVINNSLEDNNNGIAVSRSNRNTIENNYLESTYIGIHFFESHNNTIKDNYLESNNNGIRIDESHSNNIFHNNVLNNSDGIEVYYSNDNNISNNNIDGNMDGIALYTSHNNRIVNNDIIQNWDGIITYSSENNFISMNHLFQNGEGMKVNYGNSNMIIENEVANNSRDGLYIIWSENNSLINNNVSSNHENGIYVRGSGGNILESNTINSNNGFGIYLDRSQDNKISSNNLQENGICFESSGGNLNENNMITGSGFFIIGRRLAYWNNHNIDTSNLVNGRPVHYIRNQNNGTIPQGAGQIILANCTNLVLENQVMSNSISGVILGYTSNCNIINNTITDGTYGIYLHFSDNNNITFNNAFNNEFGIHLEEHSDENNVTGNTVSINEYGIYSDRSDEINIIANNISNNEFGLHISSSFSNIIHHNNFLTNTEQLNVSTRSNRWNNRGGEGNFWSSYNGIDSNGDGIGDTMLPHLEVDEFPLMEPADITLYYEPQTIGEEPNRGEGVAIFLIPVLIIGLLIAFSVIIIIIATLPILKKKKETVSPPFHRMGDSIAFQDLINKDLDNIPNSEEEVQGEVEDQEYLTELNGLDPETTDSYDKNN